MDLIFCRYHKWENAYTPPRDFRRYHNRLWKNDYKRQFRKWLQNPDYEIVDQTKATSAKWDWN